MEELEKNSNTKKSIALSFYTFLSRILGLVRDHYMAVSFGTGLIASAFSVAYRLPNMYRNLLAEGTLSQSFMPIYSDASKVSDEEAKLMSGAVLTFLSFFLMVFISLFLLAAPYFLPLLVGGTLEYYNMVIELSAILFFLIFTASLSSIYISIANSKQKFFVPSLSPIILNLAYLFVFLFLFQFYDDVYLRIKVLCFGIIAGGFIQLYVQSYYIKKLGLSPKLNFKWKHPAIKKILTLMTPAVIGGGFYQISLLVDIFLANYIQNQNPGLGAVVSLDYSQRLIQLPTGIIGVALATTTLPSLLESLKKKEESFIPEKLISTLSFAIYITLPACIGFILLGEEIIDSIFFGGAWDKNSTATTLRALQFYSIGIPAFSMNKILISSYYAFQDTKTPLKVNLISFSFNIMMNICLMKFLLHSGLALSSAISAGISFMLLIYFFKNHSISLNYKSLFIKIKFFVFPILGLMIWILLLKNFHDVILQNLDFFSYANKQRIFTFLAIFPSILIYFFISHLFQLEEYKIIFGRLFKKFKK